MGQGVCSSSALAPVFSQNFGTGSSSTSTSTVPSGFITNYTYQSSGSLNDGQYIVTPKIQNAQRSDWATGGDHTGNTNGNMFLVNAGTGASLFFYQQVDNLCPGSVYSFSAWLVNVNTISKTLPICGSGYVYPKVTFNIRDTNGNILQSYTTDTLPLTKTTSSTPNWQQYGFQFTLPSGITSLVLEMVDYYGGSPQCGNDLAIDDILFSACTPTATATLSTSSSICVGTSTTISTSLINSPFLNPAYQWQKSTDNGSTWTNIGTSGTSAADFNISNAVVGDAGVYRVLVGPDVSSLSSSTCVTASNTISLSVNSNPSASAGISGTTCTSRTIQLNGSASGGTSPYTYLWSGPNSFSSSASSPGISNLTTAASGTYTLLVTDNNGCTSNASVNLSVGTTPALNAISGGSGVCMGSSLNLSNTTAGGTWSSSNTSVATINNAGTVTPLSGGSSIISYVVSNGGCADTVQTTIQVGGVTLHPDVIECNNGITHFNATDTYYGVTYVSSNAGSTYHWSINGGSFSFQGSSTSASQYPNVQLQNGSAYQVAVQYTTNGVTCSDTQMVYKNTSAADTIQGSHDTTICNSAASLSLSGKVSPVTDSYTWSSSGTGSFSSTNTLSTLYTFSAADKTAGRIVIYLKGASSLNATGNCGTATSSDSIIVRITAANTAADSAQTICSGQRVQFTPVSGIAGSSFTWTSSVTSGTITGNTITGSGNISDLLVNASHTQNASLAYTITPASTTPTGQTCYGTPFHLTVSVSPQPTLSLTKSADTVCSGTNAQIQFSASTPVSGYQWTSSAASGVTGNSSGSGASSINDILYNQSGNDQWVKYIVTATSTAGCSGVDSVIQWVFTTPTPANAGADLSLCQANTASLQANTPAAGKGVWSLVSGPGPVVFSDSSSPSTNISGLTTGTYLLQWVIRHGGCITSSDTMTITNSALSVGGTVLPDTTVCATGNTGTLRLGGYTGNVLRWESSTDNGTNWISISNTNTQQSFSNLTANTLYRAVVQNGACGSANAQPASITVNAPTNPGTLQADTTVCASSNSGQLRLTGYTGSILFWESSTDNGNNWSLIFNTSASYAYNNLTSATQFRVLLQNGVCGLAYSNVITVSLSPATVAGNASGSMTYCDSSGVGTIGLTGATGAVLFWQQSNDNGVNWSIINSTATSITYNNLHQTTWFRAAIKSGVCNQLFSGPAVITVLQQATKADAGPDQALCQAASTVLAANTPVVGSGNWSALSGNPSTASFSNTVDPHSTVSGLITGTYSFVWTISNSNCSSSSDTVQIRIDAPTVSGTLASSQTVCASGNAGVLHLSGYTGNPLQWESSYDNGNTWSVQPLTGDSIVFTNLAQTTSYRYLVQNGVCASSYSNTVSITVMQPVTAANAGADIRICNSTSNILNGNTPSSGTGTWLALGSNPSAVSFSNATDPQATVSGLGTGIYQFVWTINNGVCAASSDTVSVQIDAATVAGSLSANAVVCAASNAGTLQLSGNNGSPLQWESSTDNGSTWVAISNTGSTLAYTQLSSSTLYRVQVQNGVCPALVSNSVAITVQQLPTTANAGPDQSLCNLTSTTLAGNTPVSGTGLWTAMAGNPGTVSFSNPADAHSAVSGLTTGTYYFVWTISNGTCGSSSDTVAVVNYTPTVPGLLASDATVCASGNSGNLSLSGYSDQVIRWESSADNGSSWASIANTGATQFYSNLTSTTQYRALVQHAVCPAQYSNTITISVLQPVTIANAGSGTVIVNNVSSYPLQGNLPSSGTGTWSQLSGPTSLSFSDIHDPHSAVLGLAYNHSTPPTDGLYYLVWTISNGVCDASSDTMQLTVEPPTNPGTIGADAVVCTGNNLGTLTVSGYLGTILQWESSADNGASWQVIPSTVGKNQASYTYTNLTTTTLFRALVQNGIGTPMYTGVAATITVLPEVTPANAGPDQSLCFTTAATLAGNQPLNGSGTWSVISATGSVPVISNIHDPHSIVSGLQTGTYVFEWKISNGYCSDSRDTVTVTIVPLTKAGILSADAVVCATANSGNLQLQGYLGDITGFESSADNGLTWSSLNGSAGQPSYTYQQLNQTTRFRAKAQNGVCPADYSNPVTITVMPPVTQAAAGNDLQLCNQTSATLAANTPVSGTGSWSSLTSNPSAVQFSDIANPGAVVDGLVPGTYRFVWTISNQICSDSKDTVSVTVFPLTIAGTLSADATVCATANSGQLMLHGNLGQVIGWEYSADNAQHWNSLAVTADSLAYTDLHQTTLYHVAVQNGVCPVSYSNPVTITVLQPVTMADAGPDQHLCHTTSTTLAANTPVSGSGSWTALAGNPSAVQFTNPADPRTSVSGLDTGRYAFIWTISNHLCTDSRDTVYITVSALSIPGILSGDAVVCADNNEGKLSLSGYHSNIVQWESSTDNGQNWSVISQTADTLSYQQLQQSTSYRTLVSNGYCPSVYSNPATIHVDQPVSPAQAGADMFICNQPSAILSATAPVVGTGYWKALPSNPSTVQIINPGSPAATVNGLQTGVYQFEWTVTNGACSASRDTLLISIFPATVPGHLSADSFVCKTGNTGTLYLTGFTGTIQHWEFSTDSGNHWTVLPDTSAAYTYNQLNQTTLFRTLVQSGPCNSAYSNEVTIHVYPPTVPGTLTTQLTHVCQQYNSGSLQLTGYTGDIIQWESSSDNGRSWAVLPYTTDTYTFSNLLKNTLFRVLVKSGNCSQGYSDSLQIIVDSLSVGGSITGDSLVCVGSSSRLFLQHYYGTVQHWESSADNGNTWQLIQQAGDTLLISKLSETTVFRAWVQNGACAGTYSNYRIVTVVQPVTTAVAGQDQVICNSAAQTKLNANIPVNGAGTWAQINGPSAVTFDDVHLPAAKINGLTTGIYSFTWTIANQTCPSSASKVTVKVDNLQANFSVTPIYNCGNTVYRFTDSSSSFFGIADRKWFNQAGDTATGSVYAQTYLNAGTQNSGLQVTSRAGCTKTATAGYQVLINQYPKANIDAISEACKKQLLQLFPDVQSKDSIAYLLWNLGNGINTKDSVVNVQYLSEGSYAVKLVVSTVNRCFDSALKNILIHPTPKVDINPSTTVCLGDSVVLTPEGAVNYIWKDQSDSIVCNNCSVFKFKPTRNTVLKVIGYSEYGCSDVAGTSLRVIPPMQLNYAQADTICTGGSVRLYVDGASHYIWRQDPGLSSYNSSNPVASPKVSTTYQVIGRDDHNCFADTANIQLTVGQPTAINVSRDTVILSGGTVELHAVSAIPDIRKWQWGGNATYSCLYCATTRATVIMDEPLYCTGTNIYGCTATDTVHIRTFCPQSEVFIPNAFTPDGDGVNDLLIVQGRGLRIIKSFRVYSRWGELVFEKTNFMPGDRSSGWDGKIRGKPASPDVFVYICEAICERGTPAIFKGNVAILK